MSETVPVLSVKGLNVSTPRFAILKDISFTLHKGQTLGIIGESGCGKSTLALTLMGLLPPGVYIETGEIWYHQVPLHQLSSTQYREIRGRRIALITQDPRGAFNPLQKIGAFIQEVMGAHFAHSESAMREKALHMFTRVNLKNGQRIWDSYPHQLSGGMLQRVLIATALCLEPEILIADEPTTALDATIQKQIVYLLKRLQQENHVSMIVISHDFGVINTLCDETMVFYSGQIIEQGPTLDLIQHPFHPYTHGLLNATPHLFSNKKQLEAVPGEPPFPGNEPPGCAFAPRCWRAQRQCEAINPAFQYIQKKRGVRCFFPLDEEKA